MATPVSVIEILGPGCTRCRETYRLVQQVVDEARLDCRVEKRLTLVAAFVAAYFGPKKTATYAGLVILMATATGWAYGALAG